MAYLKNENGEIIVDATLTSYGRDKLSKHGQLGITKFSLSDDEIDYALYNVNNPDGQEFYDIAIRELPILEALPGINNVMRNHLFTDTNTGTNTTTTLKAITPDVFTSGISSTTAEYYISFDLSPNPPDYLSVYYTAISSQKTNINCTLTGEFLSPSSMTNEVMITKKELDALYGTVDPGGSKTLYSVGQSFRFKLNAKPRNNTTIDIKITAYGPVNTNTVSIPILILGSQ